MLKIRDEVDLKELEKFGFKIRKKSYAEYYRKELKTTDNTAYITIQPISREIKIDTEATYIEELGVLYDLIQANLVEKVSE